MSPDYVHGLETSGPTKLGFPPTLWGVLGRRTSLRLDVAIAFIILNLLLVAACLIALRENVTLRRDLAGDVALLTPQSGLGGAVWTGLGFGKPSLTVRTRSRR